MNYILFPAYNEEPTIEQVLLSIDSILSSASIAYHLIVCDDGSKDRTAEKVESLKTRLPLTLLSYTPNKGVANAFRTLFQEASRQTSTFSGSDVFIMMESDRTSDPALLPEMIRLIQKGNDIVCASRFQKPGGYFGFPPKRHFLSVCANRFLKLCFPIKNVNDYTIFYRAYSSKILKLWLDSYKEKAIESEGFSANAEILIKMRKAIRKAAEVPLRYRYDLKKGKSKLKVIPTIYGYLFKGGLFLRLLLRKQPVHSQ